MRAFVNALIATLVITLASASILWMVPMSSSQVFTDRPNVRL